MVWENLASQMFSTEDREFVDEFTQSQLIEIRQMEKNTLSKWSLLMFSLGKSIAACLDEEFTTSMMYCNVEVLNTLGQDACIVLDVTLACCGCEAIVEGFYSVINAHAKSGGQCNKSLIERGVVDWALPHPLVSPSTITKIGELYTRGNPKLGIQKHRSPTFFDI